MSLDGLPAAHLRVLLDGLPVFASTFSYIDLERLARRHEPDLDLETVLDHLAGVSVFPEEDFAECGLDEAEPGAVNTA